MWYLTQALRSLCCLIWFPEMFWIIHHVTFYEYSYAGRNCKLFMHLKDCPCCFHSCFLTFTGGMYWVSGKWLLKQYIQEKQISTITNIKEEVSFMQLLMHSNASVLFSFLELGRQNLTNPPHPPTHLPTWKWFLMISRLPQRTTQKLPTCKKTNK